MPQEGNLPKKTPNLEEVKPRTLGRETGVGNPSSKGTLS